LLLECFNMVFKRFCLLIDFKRFHHLIRSVQIHLGLVKLNRSNRLELEELIKPLIKLVEDGANLIQPSAILSFQLLHIALQLLGLFLVHTFNGADPVSLEYEIFLAFKGGREQASVSRAGGQVVTFGYKRHVLGCLIDLLWLRGRVHAFIRTWS
jgi:hypothetical protein